MSWNLLVYKPGPTPEETQPLGDLKAVTEALNVMFNGLEWPSPTRTALPVDGGFELELTAENGTVQDVYTHGGFNHIKQFAALCKRQGWRMADAQVLILMTRSSGMTSTVDKSPPRVK
jgi:hypothetical protein